MENKEQKGPYIVDCEPGTKAWCTCGLSNNLPHCDGSHKETAMSPHIHIVGEKTTVYICSCEKSQNSPFCDGSHNKL